MRCAAACCCSIRGGTSLLSPPAPHPAPPPPPSPLPCLGAAINTPSGCCCAPPPGCRGDCGANEWPCSKKGSAELEAEEEADEPPAAAMAAAAAAATAALPASERLLRPKLCPPLPLLLPACVEMGGGQASGCYIKGFPLLVGITK